MNKKRCIVKNRIRATRDDANAWIAVGGNLPEAVIKLKHTRDAIIKMIEMRHP
jgi:hypothetical protein